MLLLLILRRNRGSSSLQRQRKCVSLESLIVSSWVVLLTSVTFTTIVPILGASASGYNNNQNNNDIGNNGGGGVGGSFSNITLLDLYPELKDYLVKKALAQLASSSETNQQQQLQLQSASSLLSPQSQTPFWGESSGSLTGSDNYNSIANYLGNNYGNVLGSSPSAEFGVAGDGGGLGNQYPNSRTDQDTANSDFYNYRKEVLKHFHPFGSPEFYDSWKFKPSYPVSAPHSSGPSYGWTSGFPIWDEEPAEVENVVGHEVTKDFSCLAGLLGLKTLKKLKFAGFLKKLKYIGIAIIAFKLGVLLSPIAIPLLFPIILLATTVKILPLILIIVLLLKLLKKQIKLKKPFGKFLDHTSSLFFDDVDSVTDQVMRSSENVERVNKEIAKSSKAKRRTNSRRLES